jgi:hypothetical protein
MSFSFSDIGFWEYCEYGSELLVCLGCVGEYVAEYTEWRTKDFRSSLGKRSLVVLILGLGGGLFSLVRTNALAGVAIASLGEQSKSALTQAQQSATAAKDVSGQLETLSIKAKTALDNSTTALGKSEKANSAAKQASESSSDALRIARVAREEAESFEAEIAAEREDLHRLKSWRTLTLVSDIVSELSIFKDTEYTFESVNSDDEPIQLLRSIDSILQSAGWKRLPSPQSSSPTVLKVPLRDETISVEPNVETGLRVIVNAPESVFSSAALTFRLSPAPGSAPSMTTLPRIPFGVPTPKEAPPAPRKSPIKTDPMSPSLEQLSRGLARATMALREALYSHLSPPQENANSRRIQCDPGFSKTIRIVVGKKP